MAYRLSSRRIGLKAEDRVLSAECRDNNGQWHESSLPLDLLLGNTAGCFDWNTTGFSDTARHTRLTDGGATLQADFPDRSGRRRTTTVGFNDYITNDDGVLRAIVPAIFTFTPACTQKITEGLALWLDSWPFSVVKVSGESNGKVTTFFFSTSHEISAGMTQAEMLMSPNVFFIQTPTLALEQAIRNTVAEAQKPIEPITNALIPWPEKIHQMIGIEIGDAFALLDEGAPLDPSYCSVALQESVEEIVESLGYASQLEINKDGVQFNNFAGSLKIGGGTIDLTVARDTADLKFDVRQVAYEIKMAARESAHGAEREFGIFVGGVESFFWTFW